MKKIFVVLFIIFIGLFLFSCESENNIVSIEDDNIFDTEVSKNSPRITKENGNFAYILKGDEYTGSNSESLVYGKKNVVLTINVEKYKKGSCSVIIRSDYNNVLYTENINGNIIYSKGHEFEDYPEQIYIETKNFDGNIKIALVEK